MTNFTIHESNWTEEFYSIYEDVKQDILNGMKVKDIQDKYDISGGRWGTYRKELIQDGIIQPRKQGERDCKYYTHYRNRFHVQKVIDGVKHHVGTFKTEQQAKRCVQLMINCDWDVKQIPKVKEQVWGEECNSQK